MNRLVVACFAATLASFALGCADHVVDIHEDAFEQPSPNSGSASADKGLNGLRPITLGDSTTVNQDSADTAVNPNTAGVIEDHRDLLDPNVKASVVLGPVVDPAADYHMGVDGVLPGAPLDPNVNVAEPSLGLSPIAVIQAPETEGEAMTKRPPF